MFQIFNPTRKETKEPLVDALSQNGNYINLRSFCQKPSDLLADSSRTDVYDSLPHGLKSDRPFFFSNCRCLHAVAFFFCFSLRKHRKVYICFRQTDWIYHDIPVFFLGGVQVEENSRTVTCCPNRCKSCQRILTWNSSTSLKWMFGDFQPFPKYRFGIIQVKQPIRNLSGKTSCDR